MDLASNESASPLGEGERIEVRGFSDELNRWKHPPLSLVKGEAKTSRSCHYVKPNNDS
jgi:hypothetical protein